MKQHLFFPRIGERFTDSNNKNISPNHHMQYKKTLMEDQNHKVPGTPSRTKYHIMDVDIESSFLFFVSLQFF